jgi:RNA polymerase sigma factor (sigma-70 family)
VLNEPQAVDQVLPAVYEWLRQPMGRVLYRHRIPREDAEDLIQTVLLLAVAKWRDIRNPGPWLLGTLHTHCIVYWRRRRVRLKRHVPLDSIAFELPVAPEQPRRDLLAAIAAASRRLPATQRRLLFLRYVVGLSGAEAARALGLAECSIRKILDRGLAQLRSDLGEPSQRPRATKVTPGRRRADPPPAWSAAVDAWLDGSGLKAETRRGYRGHLAGAARTLGRAPLAQLAPADLAGYRTALRADGRAAGTQEIELQAVRSFLLWAGERGLHAIDAHTLRGALRWGAGARRRGRGGA